MAHLLSWRTALTVLNALGLLVVLLAGVACAGPATSSAQPSTVASKAEHTPEAPAPVVKLTALINPFPHGHVYMDARLGFQLMLPQDWQARAQPGTQAAPGNAAVTLTTADEQNTHAVIYLGVFEGAEMPAAFAARGTPSLHIGPYPAFSADRTPADKGRANCLVRMFLVGNDYVKADWCSHNTETHRALFEQVLGTYQHAPADFVAGPVTPPGPQACDSIQHMLGYGDIPWGQQLAAPSAAGWGQLKPGVTICSNDLSPDWYLFQCTELANRFISERWALPRIPGAAGRYLDYYQDGNLHPGTIRTFPAGSYQMSDDASQGKSAFRPAAGDLLIFQDVNDAQAGWKSGVTNSPGHVAVIVGVDDQYVHVAQENYSDRAYFLALPIQQVANGYAITDLTGLSNRIVRGWIHFTVNGGARN
ncbi:MAG: hypothetical protein PVS3B1_27910 [Ktedonobacteraceae bacterium]